MISLRLGFIRASLIDGLLTPYTLAFCKSARNKVPDVHLVREMKPFGKTWPGRILTNSSVNHKNWRYLLIIRG
jgi:hypothetical protein